MKAKNLNRPQRLIPLLGILGLFILVGIQEIEKYKAPRVNPNQKNTFEISGRRPDSNAIREGIIRAHRLKFNRELPEKNFPVFQNQ